MSQFPSGTIKTPFGVFGFQLISSEKVFIKNSEEVVVNRVEYSSIFATLKIKNGEWNLPNFNDFVTQRKDRNSTSFQARDKILSAIIDGWKKTVSPEMLKSGEIASLKEKISSAEKEICELENKINVKQNEIDDFKAKINNLIFSRQKNEII